MELRQLETFTVVARRASFTRAAEELHLTQPAVTRQIAALERELKTPLFDRLGKSVQLTSAGEVLLRYAGQVLGLTKEAQEAVAEVAAGTAGRLSVGASTTLATYLLPGILTRFRGAHPEVDLTIRTGISAHIATLVLNGGVDLGLVTNEGLPDVNLILEPLGAYATVLVSRPEHALAGTAPLAAQELVGQPLLLMEPGTNLRHYVDQLLASAGATAQAAMELDSVETIKRMVEAGLGISLLPEVAIAEEVSAGRLVARPVLEVGPTPRGIALACRRDKFRSAAMQAFIVLLVEATRAQAAPRGAPLAPLDEAEGAPVRDGDWRPP